MGFLKKIFGNFSENMQHVVWQKLAEELNAEYKDGGFWKTDVFIYQYKHWRIVMDTNSVSEGKTGYRYTRLRAAFVVNNKLRFSLRYKSAMVNLSEFDKDDLVKIPFKGFHNKFDLYGNNVSMIENIFSEASLVQTVPLDLYNIHFRLRDDDGIYGVDFPKELDQLQLETLGTDLKIEDLRTVFSLFTSTLDILLKFEIISDQEVKINYHA